MLLQELDRYNALTRRMGVSLRELQKALTGEIAMSNELDELASSLFAGALPPYVLVFYGCGCCIDL